MTETERNLVLNIMQTCQLLLNNTTVPTTPTTPTTPVNVPPVTLPDASGRPSPVGYVVGPELTGTQGNPKLASVPANCVVSYRYEGLGFHEFRAAGQSFNGNPANTWVWLARNPTGSQAITQPVQFNGYNVAVVEAVVSGEVYFCEQPNEDCNRYAQVN